MQRPNEKKLRYLIVTAVGSVTSEIPADVALKP